MKKIFKKGVALTAALLMLTAAFPAGVSAASGGVKVNKTTFPDANFRKYVLSKIDTDGNSSLSSDEIKNTVEIDVMEKGISSLKGIENFTSLKRLYCSGNKITELDLSKNTKLEELNVGDNEEFVKMSTNHNKMKTFGNKLTTLDVSMLPSLTSLSCCNNSLTKLDLSKNPKLMILMCTDNKIKKLDLSKNKELMMLYCSDNPLTSLNISKCPDLSSLTVKNCKLTELDLSKNKKLGWLDCTGNKLKSLSIKNTQITENYYKGDIPYKTAKETAAKKTEPSDKKKTDTSSSKKNDSKKKTDTSSTFIMVFINLNSKDGITIKWDAVEGADKYRVYRYGKGDKLILLEETDGTRINIKNPEKNTVYRCIVCAKIDGEWTSPSNSGVVEVDTAWLDKF